MILKDRTNLINLFLFLLFLSILFLLKQEKIINRESEKYNWGFSLYSNLDVTDDVTKNNDVTVVDRPIYLTQIISAELINTFDNSGSDLEKHSKNTIINNDLIYSSDEPNNFKKILPNTIKLEYYSFEENKFYMLNTKLDYDKIINFANKKEKNTNLRFVINILPKGKVDFYFDESTNNKFFIQNLNCKEVKYDWEKLKIERNTSLGSEQTYADKKNLENILEFKDYIDLVKNIHKWTLVVNLNDNKNSNDIYIKGFDNQRLSGNNHSIEKKIIYSKIPESIRIKNINYSFDGFEILTAFKKIENIKNSLPIEILCNRDKNSFKCFLQKGDVIIDLKNIY